MTEKQAATIRSFRKMCTFATSHDTNVEMVTNKRRTSLKDIAQELGVSIATVSRALRSSPEIGAAMQEKVKELVIPALYEDTVISASLLPIDSFVHGAAIVALQELFSDPVSYFQKGQA